jgi:hypothetical protein
MIKECEEEGHIRITEIRSRLGCVERYEYAWEGKSPITTLGAFLVLQHVQRPADAVEKGVFTIGPFRLRVLEIDRPCGMHVKAIRTDSPFWFLVWAVYRATPILRQVYFRSIITLAVWGLADFHNDTTPSLHDIHCVNRVCQAVKKWRAGKGKQ